MTGQMPEACSSAQSHRSLIAGCALAAWAPVVLAAELDCPPFGAGVADEEWEQTLTADPLDQRIDVQSDEATLGVDGDATLYGDVRVRQGNRQIRAEEVSYDSEAGAFEVEGSVEYRDPIVRVIGSDGRYSAAEGARFNAAEFELRERAARGQAETIELTPGGVIELDDVRFTSCPADDVAWQLRAGARGRRPIHQFARLSMLNKSPKSIS